MGTPPAPSPELARLSLLRAFKERMTQLGNVSPFHDRIVTASGPAAGVDVPTLHAEVRRHVEETIARVRDRRQSEVILISGQAGTGKSHLLRHFRDPAVAAAGGYVFVGGANHWQVDEFQPCLLDWVIQALVGPTPSGEHLLLDRVRLIAFRAIDQLLENRSSLGRCLARPAGGVLGRLAARWSRAAAHEAVRSLAAARDPAVFARLEFAGFSEYVCDRFLAEPGHLPQRYALRVLLTYLFPDPAAGGVGLRERVLHWFRRRPDDGYFARRLGVAEDLDRRYAVADAVRLLVHLFSPEVSRELDTPAAPCRPLVFMLVFDQVEGRDELFDREEDWLTFFAHLSELYNTLPNVLVLFTMTLGLRSRLHPKMERQFKDRIRQDERFVLRHTTPAQVLDLYRARLDAWLADDPPVAGAYRDQPEPCLPFDREAVLAAAGQQGVRDTLEAFDREFTRFLRDEVQSLEPEYDFQFVLNEARAQVPLQGDFEFSAGHLTTVRGVLEAAGDWLPDPAVQLVKVEVEQEDSPPILKLTFAAAADPSDWAVVYLARFGHFYNSHVPKCLDLLYMKQKAKYSVWMVRAKEFSADHDAKPDQVFRRLAPADLEARLQAVLHLLRHREQYDAAGTWPAVQAIVRREVAAAYLGELLQHARDRVVALAAATSPAPTDAAPAV